MDSINNGEGFDQQKAMSDTSANEINDGAKKAPDKPRKKINWPVLLLTIIAVGLAAYIGYNYYSYNYKGKNTSVSPTPVSVTTNKTATPAGIEKVVDAGVKWQTVQKLDDLQLFKAVGESDVPGGLSSVNYYKIGTLDDGSEVIAAILDFSPGYPKVHRFIKKGDTYKLIVQNSDTIDENTYTTTKPIEQDNTTVFKSLLPDKTIEKGNTKLLYKLSGSPEQSSGFTSEKLVGETKWGNLYYEQGDQVTTTNDAVRIGRYFIRLSDNTKAYYDPAPTFIRDDGTLNLTWADSNTAKTEFQKFSTDGCGNSYASFPAVTSSTVLTDKKVLVEGTGGAKVYIPGSADNSLVSFGFDLASGGSNKFTKDTYYKDNGIIIWADDYGTPIVFANKQYAPVVECGKPVVYLYPTDRTVVSVKLAADITKSEPTYGEGWRVIANPDGQILLGDKVYPYLFWEGKGQGQYPAIKSGAVVARADVEKTIRANLSYIGLNDKEIGDFLDFWLAKMPNKPFVRLTWFQNDQLDRLAPIKITPKPDSLIRVFLDFEGMEQRIDLPKQDLIRYERKGFTAIEWGGLLKGNN